MPTTPTTPSSVDPFSFEALIMQSENLIRSWSGFSRDTLLRAPSTSSQASRSTTTSTTSSTENPHLGRTTQQMTTSQPPPIPARAPGHSFHTPRQPLRKRRSPKVLSLRELRAKDSEAQLRSVYETQTLAYLNDDIQPYSRPGGSRLKWSYSESSSEEDIKEEPEEDEQYFMAPEK
ncbi:hypothetical protein BDZ85DRAFT_80782 [Elsinoe ampelina]|uniref:Uncharacterized protein n=1 Tax=Elsinoe ampelina TaxID=302913 RepID=A0A6A6FZB8_9PEZI|nr:hypothetical protein BDZ85DRAFT_80782 [Elsinoe ampelina]